MNRIIALALVALFAGLAQASPCTDGDYIEKLNCERRLKAQDEANKVVPVQPTRMDTTISISIHGTDTTKTITIRRAESWEGTQKSVRRFVNTYTIFGVINVLAVLAAMVFVITD